MSEQDAPLSWPKIIGITLAAGLLAGLLVGGLSTWLGWGQNYTTTSVGAVTGVVAASLITQRQGWFKKRGGK